MCKKLCDMVVPCCISRLLPSPRKIKRNALSGGNENTETTGNINTQFSRITVSQNRRLSVLLAVINKV